MAAAPASSPASVVLLLDVFAAASQWLWFPLLLWLFSLTAAQRRWRRRCSRNLGLRMVAGASQGSFVGSSSPEFQICDEEWRWRSGAVKLWQVCGGGVTLLQVKVAAQFVVSARFCDGREWRKMVVARRVADLLQRRGGRGGCALQMMRRGGRRRDWWLGWRRRLPW
ncbi:hypothetical protein DEO72_LG4g22 [Vigna unguiculata]|uniref:Uncharacterized protein n=1 Tax=Vigna unguiculata TaxID=3917 RepID=A0A4D6LM13_VIGUN|nr:hypothetical protein DEO72_LG4g22 [Vigna unguiculata]